jgi:hypothetical protein
LKRDEPATPTSATSATLETQDLEVKMPLPPHFPPVTAETGTSTRPDGYLSLTEAFAACWPETRLAAMPPDGEITQLDAENYFGKIKKSEVLSKSGDAVKVGLLFDKSIFPTGAAGSAIQTEGRWTELRFRAAGRMLHCEKPNRCECI